MDSEQKFSVGPVDGYAEGEEPIVFHHQDGEFRKYEKKLYSDLATGQNQPKRGLFRVLVGTKMNRMIFFAMIVTFVVVMGVGIFGGKSYEDTVDGVFCSMAAFSFGDDVYVSVSMKRSGSKQFRDGVGPKNIEIKAVAVDSDGADSAVENRDFLFTDSGEDEVCRFTFRNYDITKINALVSSSGTEKKLSCKVVAR